MLFNSAEFALFFPLVTALYFFLPHRYRWFLLLAASCIFYMAFIPIYIVVLLGTITIDFFCGLLIENTSGRRRSLYLVISILSNVGILAVFKYYNFAAENLTRLAEFIGWNYSMQGLQLVLPIGLSFHTFQSLSYVIEVYRGEQRAERHLGVFALYVMFYPQLVAGPIERPQNLLHQFYEQHSFDYPRVVAGLQLMAWGLFKKVVIADRLALAVNHAYHDPALHHGLTLAIATVFFAFQIYCDFSGYTDIARGAAQVMGFRLMQNFDRPYLSRSISEFWGRWHISLSTWFRDYLYIPLGGNRGSKWRWYSNLLITFVVSGLWHGAGWNFIIWGALNGLYLVGGVLTKKSWEKLLRGLGLGRWPLLQTCLEVGITFALICISWVFFRANTLTDAFYILGHSATGLFDFLIHPHLLGLSVNELGLGLPYLLVVLCALAVLQWVDLMHGKEDFRVRLQSSPPWSRWAVYYGILLSIAVFGVFNRSQFIYFQF